VILGLSPQILEDGLLPVSLHMVPVVNHTMTNRIVNAVAWGSRVCQGLITNEEVEIFNPTLRGQMAWLCWDSRSRGRCIGVTTRGNGCGYHAVVNELRVWNRVYIANIQAWVRVSSETWRCSVQIV
jgi:hypothetical protein